MTAKVARRHLILVLLGVAVMASIAAPAAVHAVERVSMPWRCAVVKGQVRLEPARGGASIDYVVIGRREQQPFSFCAGIGHPGCPLVVVHRLTVQCGSERVTWVDIAQALLAAASVRSHVDHGRLVVGPTPAPPRTVARSPGHMAPSPCPPPDRPVAPFHLGHKIDSDDCAASSEPGGREIVLPHGFAPIEELGVRLTGGSVPEPVAARTAPARSTVVSVGQTTAVREPPPAVSVASRADLEPAAKATAGTVPPLHRVTGSAGAVQPSPTHANPGRLSQVQANEAQPAGIVTTAVGPPPPSAVGQPQPAQAPAPSNVLAQRAVRDNAVETSPLPDIAVPAAARVAAPRHADDPLHAPPEVIASGHGAVSASEPSASARSPEANAAPARGASTAATAGGDRGFDVADAGPPTVREPASPGPATSPGMGLGDAVLPRVMMVVHAQGPWTLMVAGLLTTTAALIWTFHVVRQRRRLPTPVFASAELLPLAAPERQPLLEAAPQIEALCDQTLRAISALDAAPPLQEVLDGEVRMARQRLAAAVAAGAGGDDGSRRAAAMCRNIVRDLDRVRRIADSAVVSFRGSQDHVTAPATCAEAYAVLGVNADIGDATLKKLADALRMSWHPDHARDDADRARREARTKQINIALDMIRGTREPGAT